MNKLEAKRRALAMAATIVESTLDTGMDLGGYTDDGSSREIQMLGTALAEVIAGLRRRLPPDWLEAWFMDQYG